MTGSRRGFTLVEMMVAVGIVGIAIGLTVTSFTRSRQVVRADRALHDLRGRIEEVRAMARAAGSRTGVARPNYLAGCPNDAGDLLWIRIRPNGADFPRNTEYDAVADTLDVTCTPWDFGGWDGPGGGTFEGVGAPFVFGFSANGRLAFPTGQANRDVFLRLQTGVGPAGPGLRVLPGGSTCIASDPAPANADEVCDQ